MPRMHAKPLVGPHPAPVGIYGHTDPDTPPLVTMTPWDAASLARDLNIAAQLAAGPTWRPCQYCPAPMVMATTDLGRPMPLDPGDHPAGNLAVRYEAGKLKVRGVPPGKDLEPGEHRAMSHFATCPKSDLARRPKPGPPPAPTR